MQWFQLIPGALMLWLGAYYVYCYIKKKPIVRKNHPMPVTVGHLLFRRDECNRRPDLHRPQFQRPKLIPH